MAIVALDRMAKKVEMSQMSDNRKMVKQEVRYSHTTEYDVVLKKR